jgi:hypothetical protein
MKYVQTVPIVALFLVMAYFALFNWNVFIVSLNIDVGLGVIAVPLVATVFLVGLFFLGLQTGLTYFVGFRRNRDRTLKESEIGALKKEKDLEISALKASFYDEQPAQIKQNALKIAELESVIEETRASLVSEAKSGIQAGPLPGGDQEVEK